MANLAVECAAAPHSVYSARRRCDGRIGRCRRLLSTIVRAASSSYSSSQSGDIQRNKFDKELGMSSLKKKIEDSVNRAQMLGETALELEEARKIKQEELIREYDLWDDLAKSYDILIKLADSSKVVDALKDIRYKAEEAKLITELTEMDIINDSLFKQAYTASVDVSKFLDKYEISKLLKGPYDVEGACIVIEADGGIRSEIWVEQLVEMYMKWAGKQGFQGRTSEKICTSKRGGVKSIIIEFESKFAYGYFSGERGTHCMINSSPESLLSEVSTAAVDVIPLFLEATPELNIDDKDLKINELTCCNEDHYRILRLVQIQHCPTGLTVEASGERNQFSNKMKALNRLKAKLLAISRDQGVSGIDKIRKDAIPNLWHEECRRYVFSPYKLVQDVKTGIQLAGPNAVLNGNLDPFISAHVNSKQVHGSE